MQCMLTRPSPQLFQISTDGCFNFHLQSVSLVLFKAGKEAICRLPHERLAACFAEGTRLAYNLLLIFVLTPTFLGLFWWIQQIIYKHICQQNDILGGIQDENCNLFLISRLAPFGTMWIRSVCLWNKSRNKCNVETKYFFSQLSILNGQDIIIKMEGRKGEMEGMKNRAL